MSLAARYLLTAMRGQAPARRDHGTERPCDFGYAASTTADRTNAMIRTKSQLLSEILHEFEEAGDAMRYLNSKGQIAWKATPRLLTRLADAEQEARDDAEHDMF